MPRPSRHPPERSVYQAALATFLLLLAGGVRASGGLVLQNDVCVLTIDFYESHFTAYQPNARGNEEFCHHLPGAGRTIIVLDYLHRSLKEVPVEFRIIRDVTGKGQFVREEDVATLDDVGQYTVFHQEPRVAGSGTMTLEMTFEEEGDYVGIVTAGHPTADSLHTAVFPIGVGTKGLPWGWIAFGTAVLVGGGFALALKRIGSTAA